MEQEQEEENVNEGETGRGTPGSSCTWYSRLDGEYLLFLRRTEDGVPSEFCRLQEKICNTTKTKHFLMCWTFCSVQLATAGLRHCDSRSLAQLLSRPGSARTAARA